MRTFRRLLGFALFVAALVVGWRFATANGESVAVDWLVVQAPAQPLWQVLLVAFALGGAIAGAVGAVGTLRQRLIARRWRRAASGLEAEIHQLRNLPLATPEPGAPRGSAGRAPAAGAPDRNG